ncbi:hypothetical protein ABZT03_07515 [Streptomyces sp. NPDC005574]|uniref:hypothetical protein n=1 Tax=Streptomyces sp. NPDC005574 TaxID=3156891 RepID=UPI0033AC1F62
MPRTTGPPPVAAPPRALLAIQQAAGNAATSQAVRRGRSGSARTTGRQRVPAPLPAVEERTETGFVLPPYLMELETGGLSTAYGLTGHEFVRHAVASVVGHGGGTVAALAADLAGRPESFFGAGRAFAVEGGRGKESYDVTVRISRAPGDKPPVFQPPGQLATASPGRDGVPQAELEDAEGKDTKVDVQHNTSAGVSTTAGGSSSKGAGGLAFGLAPVAPGVWVGAAATGNAQPWQSSRESRGLRTVAEPRVLRSDKGSVEVPRAVRYEVRVKKHGTSNAQTFQDVGTLTQRVPVEHLVPVGTTAPHAPRPVTADTARAVSLADSLAPLGVSDTAAPHRGGGGLFDAVASVLHPSLTAPGAPGLARLYRATSTATVLEDMPRLLRDGVTGEDLHAKDGRSAGSYRMRAAISGLSPAWSTGKTQLRTHQQTQSTVTDSAGKGRALTAGLGPAIGLGAAGNAAVVRGTAMPVAGARKARFTVNEQTVSSRQGAEVRGEKVLYTATVRFTVEGTGPRSARMVLDPSTRVAEHSMKVWMSLRADEARELGLPLPPGTAAGEFVEKPKRTDENGEKVTDGYGREVDVERHLPFGAMGSSVALSRLDTGPMVRAVQELFATDPRLAGYLPAFGLTPPGAHTSREEAEAQRDNHRELMTALSETNLRVNKDQLLSTGIRVRLRRKTTLHAHDVQIRVKGALRETGYLGDTKDWMVRSHSGVTSNAQSGRSSSRSIGGLVLGQVRLVPGVLTGAARYERHSTGTRRNQAGPTTRTDLLTNGSETAATFGAALRLDVGVTMTSRPRKLARGLTPGAPGRDVPEPKTLAGLHLEEQDVRLVTPAEFTLDDEGRQRQRAVAGGRRAQAPRPDWDVAATGIGDLAALVPRPSTGEVLRDWQLVETLGDGQPVRDLALRLLSRAAARNKGVREDPALAAEGLAPRLAVEERLAPQAITAALRQAASSGWVVKNLRYPRRLAALNGAVGTRLTLTNPKFLHRGAGPGTETFVLGGHQAAGQQGQSVTTTVQAGATGTENGPEWRTGQGLSAFRTTGRGGAESSGVSGTVERNAHTPKKAPLYLVQCDLLVNMVAEVQVTGGGPYVAKEARTLPAEAAVWLTEAQLPASVRRQLEQEGERKAKRDAERKAATPSPRDGSVAESSRAAAERAGRDGERAASSGERAAGPVDGRQRPAGTDGVGSSGGVPAGPVLPRGLPLGFGMIEELPDFVPLLESLRSRLARGDRPGLAEDLLPRQQLKDRNDNVQRLLRVLDRDGAAGLLSGAMDGGVTVELFDGRRTPYWAVFKVDRVGNATPAGPAEDGRDMEYITSAVAQQATSRDESAVTGVEGVLAGSGKPEAGAGQLKSLGGGAGLGLASGDSRRAGEASRGQLGMKTVAEASTAKSARTRMPIRASLELYRGGTRLGLARMDGLTLTHRAPEKDLAALARVSAPRADALRAGQGPRAVAGDPAAGLGAWRADGVRLPMEAQVNGFQGAPRVRELVNSAVRQAGGGDRFGDRGQAAAHTLQEAVSTEWLIAALPLLTTAGADLPPVHASGATGQDLRASVHARLRNGRVLGVGDKMTFETVGQSHLDAPRPTQTDGVSSTDRGRAARGLAGAGLLNADEFRLNQLMGNSDGSGGTSDGAVNSAGSMPLHKPKLASVLVQFTLDVRVVARVTDRVRTSRTGTAVREITLPTPVVIRMPEPAVRRMLAAQGGRLQDPDHHLGTGRAVPPPAP